MEQHRRKSCPVYWSPWVCTEWPNSCVQRTLEVFNLFSAEAQFQRKFLPNLSSLCSPPVIIYHPPLKPWSAHTGYRGRANAAPPRAFTKIHVLSGLVWDSFGQILDTQMASAWFRVEGGRLCIWAWGGMTGQSCWRGHNYSLPLTLVQGRRARWGAAGEAGVEELHGGLWVRRLGPNELAEAQKGRNRSHLLWTWEENQHT